MSAYAWVIDKDHYGEGPEGTYQNAVGIFGPRDADGLLLRELRDGQGRKFRMHDDDGELVYEGRIAFKAGEPEDGEDLGPLHDFGAPNFGCTLIAYEEPGRGWVAL